MIVCKLNIRMKCFAIVTIAILIQLNAFSQQLGTFTDNRDNQVYRTVEIGRLVWMNENLAYAPKEGNFWTYNNDKKNLIKYGFLYDWDTAQEVCPLGWHLPSAEEWDNLSDLLGNTLVDENANDLSSKNRKGNNLKSTFATQLGGYRHYEGAFYEIGEAGYWWSSTVDAPIDTWSRYVFYTDSNLVRYNLGATDGFSVRCVKDYEQTYNWLFKPPDTVTSDYYKTEEGYIIQEVSLNIYFHYYLPFAGASVILSENHDFYIISEDDLLLAIQENSLKLKNLTMIVNPHWHVFAQNEKEVYQRLAINSTSGIASILCLDDTDIFNIGGKYYVLRKLKYAYLDNMKLSYLCLAEEKLRPYDAENLRLFLFAIELLPLDNEVKKFVWKKKYELPDFWQGNVTK